MQGHSYFWGRQTSHPPKDRPHRLPSAVWQEPAGVGGSVNGPYTLTPDQAQEGGWGSHRRASWTGDDGEEHGRKLLLRTRCEPTANWEVNI